MKGMEWTQKASLISDILLSNLFDLMDNTFPWRGKPSCKEHHDVGIKGANDSRTRIVSDLTFGPLFQS